MAEGESFRSSALAAEGTVVELVRSTNRDGDRILLPNVRYTNQAGEQKTFLVEEDRTLFGYAKGQTVSVIYSPDGTDARLDSVTSRWGVPGVIGLMGLIFTGVGVFMGPGGSAVGSEE